MAYDHNTTTMTSVGGRGVRRSPSAPAHQQPRGLASGVSRAGELVAMAHRLLSETAHDLRSPLMAVRESARLVNDGYLGPITDEQQKALLGAIDCCGDMEQLIDSMLRLERLRDAMPRVHRQWVDAATITESVSSRVAAVAFNEQVSVLWDGPSSGRHLVYADPDKLRRLLLNLLSNAIRATPTGGQVLVRTEPVKARGTLHFSVVDRGCGMQTETLRRLAIDGSSACGGAGVGLAVNRQMASLHFSNLEITSQPERGTRVEFEVPSAGPSAVADSWCRWRELFRSSRTRPLHRGIRPASAAEAGSDNSGFEAATEFCNDSVVLTHEGPPPQHPNSMTALSLQVADSTPVEVATRMDERLQEGLRMYELAYRAAERRWVMLWDADGAQATDRIANANRSLAASLPTVRFSWSKAIQLPVGGRATRASIRDLLVRDTLGAGAETPLGDDRRMARGGPARPSTPPGIVARRLDAELRRLAGRAERQRMMMQQQAAAIRPPLGLLK